MSENPFEAPKPASDRPAGEPMPYQHDGSGRSYVRQVNVVASLMIAQGVLMLLFALVAVGYAVFFGNMQSWMSAAEQARLERELPAAQRQFLAIIFWCWSVFSVLLAVLFITAGCLNLGLKARAFGIATLLIGLGTMLTCYCALTGIPLSIYGLIIYFHPAVAEAFRMRKEGMLKSQVVATFVR